MNLCTIKKTHVLLISHECIIFKDKACSSADASSVPVATADDDGESGSLS